MKTNWLRKKLGDVIELHYGKGIPKHDRNSEGKYPIYGANGELGRTDKFLVESDAIIIGRKGSAGEVTRVSGKFWPSDVTYYVLENNKVDLDYIFHLFKSLNLPKLAVGVKPGINRNRIYEIEIPLPPIGEQKRIVAKLEKLLAKIKEAKKLRAQSLEATQNLLPAELHKIFEEGKKNGWEEKEIFEITERSKTIDPKTLPEDKFLYIDITSVNIKSKKNLEPRILSKNEAPSRARKLVQEGDTIFATTRPYLKNVALITKVLDGSIASTGFCVLRPKTGLVDPKYLFLIVSSDPFINEVSSFQKGATYPAVSDTVIYKRKILLPPLAEQKKIVAHLDSLSEKVEELKKLQLQTATDLDALEKSLLHQAFEGKL